MNDENQTLRDAELSRLYREGAHDEPPAMLDAAILSAARAAVAPASKRRPWWRAWSLPLSVAASAFIVVSLALMMEDSLRAPPAQHALPAEGMPVPLATPPAQDAAAASAARSEPPAASAGGSEEATAATAVMAKPSPEHARRQAPAAAAPAPAVPAPAREDTETSREKMSPAEAVNAGEQERTRAAGARTGAGLPAAPVMERAAPPAAATMRAVPAAKAAHDGQVQALPQSAPLSTQAWIEKIRQLKASGRQEDAARELAEFLKAHPGYPLPEDLR